MATNEPRDPRDMNQDDRRDSRLVEGPYRDARDRRRSGDDRDLRAPGDVRDIRTIADVADRPAVRHALASIVAGAFILLGLSLCFEPQRWGRTPAYADLLTIAPQRTWGLALISIALLLGLAIWVTNNRAMSLIAHLIAITFTAGWMVAFTVRWATDVAKSTTPMNAVTWLLILAVLVTSLRNEERHRAVLAQLGERQ